jgi:hypothetical protein
MSHPGETDDLHSASIKTIFFVKKKLKLPALKIKTANIKTISFMKKKFRLQALKSVRDFFAAF